MAIFFRILEQSEIHLVIPLVEKLNHYNYTKELLIKRFSEMITQNYECAAVFDDQKLIGISGMWFCTRHYSGKSMEVDHVYIEESYRNKGLGKQFLEWVCDYGKSKGCESCELNTYVSNPLSHKFYFKADFSIYAYHFFKKL